MIINVRGTSGSGKSTLIRKIMDRYQTKVAVKAKGRKQPLGYILHNPDSVRWLAVPGHYETPCGGCDTIPNMAEVFHQVRAGHKANYDVLFEGAIVSTLAKQIIEMHQEGFPIEVVSLNTPLEDCLAGIQERRDARGDTRPLSPKATEGKYKSTRSTHAKFQAAGVPAIWASRADAERYLCQRLGLKY